jgi:GTP-binding protein Era
VSEALRCGYVALVGRPNVGKSTLLNHLLGRKLSITSRKPQTTRYNLLGVITEQHNQVIFVDTPGIHPTNQRAMNRYMVRSATSVLSDVDIVVMVVERTRWTPEDDLVLSHVERAQAPKICVINKIDQLKGRTELLPQMEKLGARAIFDEIIPISALRNDGLDLVRQEVIRRLPEGPHLFPADQITDRSERFIVSEIIREKLMRRLGDELPHRISVVIENYQSSDRLVEIDANIFVERDGQKTIIIGRKGALLKSIGMEARHEIEALVETKVMLRLWVKVKSGWTNDERSLRRLGFE